MKAAVTASTLPLPKQTPSVQQVVQLQTAKFSNGLQAGLKLLATEGINCPITLTEGLADLKWLLQALLTGQFIVNFDPQSLGGVPQTEQKESTADNAGNGEEVP